MEILINKVNDETFNVSIQNRINSNHIVVLDNKLHFQLTLGSKTKEELILFSFKFLLEREKNTSIFSNFKLDIIQNHFPEYKKTCTIG